MGSELPVDKELVEKLHRRIHAKPRPPRYQPITVTEALHKLRRSLEASILLGLYGLIENDAEAAIGIIDIEREIDEVAYQLLAHISMAVGHHVEDAAQAAPLYTYVLAVDKIMDAVKDLASLTIRGHRLSKEVSEELMALSDEPLVKIRGLNKWSVGKLLDEYSIDVLAIKRGDLWILDPSNEEQIEENDTVYVWGAKDAINDLFKDIGKEPLPKKEGGSLAEIVSSIEMLLVMNELAHYQLRAQDAVLADEIMELEMFMDELRVKNTKAILSQDLGYEDAFLLISLVTRIEDISDALTYIIVMPAEEEYREILSSLVEAAGDKISIYKAGNYIELAAVVEALEEIGATVLAVKKGQEWIAVTPYNAEKLRLEPGDSILVEYEKPLEKRVAEALQKLGFTT